MREIKFRAWDKLNQVMGDVLQYIQYAGENGTIKIDINSGVAYMSHDFELMQFTGLLDKNGKEIYEGDIVAIFYKDNPNNGISKKNEVKWGVYNIGANGYEYDFDIVGPYVEDEYVYYSMIGKEVTVIGNIYENPDLIPN